MSMMASVSDIYNDILSNGFYFADDGTIGQRLVRMDADDIAPASAAGLQFCQENVLKNEASTSPMPGSSQI